MFVCGYQACTPVLQDAFMNTSIYICDKDKYVKTYLETLPYVACINNNEIDSTQYNVKHMQKCMHAGNQ